MGSKIHQLGLLVMTFYPPSAMPTYNSAGSRWIVCTTGCAILPLGTKCALGQRVVGVEACHVCGDDDGTPTRRTEVAKDQGPAAPSLSGHLFTDSFTPSPPNRFHNKIKMFARCNIAVHSIAVHHGASAYGTKLVHIWRCLSKYLYAIRYAKTPLDGHTESQRQSAVHRV